MASDFYHDHEDRAAFRLMNRLFGLIILSTLAYMGYAVTTRHGYAEPPLKQYPGTTAQR